MLVFPATWHLPWLLLLRYDVPYHQRIAIDTGRRVGKWYTVKEEGGERAAALTPCESRKAFGEPRVLAFDIECVKQPLKFPDATVDPVMMISYMIDGAGKRAAAPPPKSRAPSPLSLTSQPKRPPKRPL